MGAISVFIIIFVLFIIIRNSNKTTKTTTVDKIPETFIEFPEYSGILLKKPKITTTPKYVRITMFYKGDIDENYLDTLNRAGFEKASPVRYDKNNTYVIVEKINHLTKIAFHIKTAGNNSTNPVDNNNPISF
ncbi:MAG: hypothetical protein IKK43_05150 [Clostridia bacterium]|nr:hypothetical protein [Clostridia bacterium]